MPTTVAQLFNAADVGQAGVVPWGVAASLNAAGVYIVARTDAIDALVRSSRSDVSAAAVAILLETRPELTVDGHRPSVPQLVDRLGRFWLPDEPVVYVGLAGTSVRSRVNEYYRTRLGARKPHAGGWFLKTLSGLSALWVHYAAADDPDAAERLMLGAFCAGVSDESRGSLLDPERPFPFGNLEWPRGIRKRHGIVAATEPRVR
jgi:hypothetical protein